MSFSKRRAKLPKQPDLIIIITDQERATQHFPKNWESDNLKTMTFLKEQGFSFDRAFCNSCMCSPSRATLFTGTYPAHHGVTQTLTWGGRYSDAEITLDPSLFNMARMLQEEGYDVQYRGKWHLNKGDTENDLSPSQIALTGFEGWIAPDAGEDVKPENFGGGFANHDEKYIKQGTEYLKRIRTERESGATHVPYCLVLSLVNPHDVLAYPDGVGYGYYKEDWASRDIRLPKSVTEDLLENKKPMAQFQIMKGAGKLLGALPTREDKLSYINFYGHTLQKIDGQIGEFIDELYKGSANGKKLADDAIVIRLSDHGEMGMAHGGMRQKAFNAYEETLRVPMVISNPILFPKDDEKVLKSSDNLASLIDIMPTIASLVGIKKPARSLQGKNLVPIMEDNSEVQESIMFTFDDTKASSADVPSAVFAANRVRCIRTKDWKYSYYFHALGSYRTEYELYHIAEGKDPNEMHNLAYSNIPKIIAKKEELAALLEESEEKLLKYPNVEAIIELASNL
jgi:arylsulfatase A-like enzyme